MSGLFIGLPAEFSPPEKAADAIVALRTRAEREAYWLRLPEQWRPFIGELCRLFLGLHIGQLETLEARRAALAEVPPIWLDEVKWHVRYVHRWAQDPEAAEAVKRFRETV
jgi:hypothetical protein